MKNFMIALLALSCVIAPVAKAAAVSASPYRLSFSGTNLTTAAYVQAFSAAQVVKSVKAFSVYNSGNKPIFIAVGPAGSEVNQILVQPNTDSNSGSVIFPLVVSQNNRISVIASTGTISSGELEINLFYN